MSNYENTLILVKGEDKTFSIRNIRFDRSRRFVFINYKNSTKEYTYYIRDVLFLKNPIVEEIENRLVLKDESPLNTVQKILFFGQYCRVLYKNGFSELVNSSRIRIVKSVLSSQKSWECFEYLKSVANQVGIFLNGRNILLDYYNKIDFVREDSVLANFLSGKYEEEQKRRIENIIYPFGFNLSQKNAVENAISNRLSIIDGPPGTGKTQTILNIIANAVIQGKSVAVVSNNNAATENVFQKLKKYEVDFIAATLGKSINKEAFILSQNSYMPNMDEWENCFVDLKNIIRQGIEIEDKLKIKNRLSAVVEEEDVIKKEYGHFMDYYKKLNCNNKIPIFSKKITSKKILKFMAEFEILHLARKKIGFFKKIKFKLMYGIKNSNFYEQPLEIIQAYCQKLYYFYRLKEIVELKVALNKELDAFDFDAKLQLYTQLSMSVFKAILAKKYNNSGKRKFYNINDLWRNTKDFISDYPVILSTTYSLRASLADGFMYDYVIIDEASQVDLVTGALALSCAKRAVIVGDLKQLPNVVDNDRKKATDYIFEKYNFSEAYRYSQNSLLSSFLKLFPQVSHVLLREHYRCHPQIIGFCNQCFYNNQLIVMTKPKNSRQPMKVYRTVPGNHARGHVNQRQIDVIKEEVFPKEDLNFQDGSVGIVTPYRNQADVLKKVFAQTSVQADTVDKYQGQEKNVIIFSTVDNQISAFASDPNRLNVAVSRAIDQFIVVTDGNDNDQNSPIHELIGYIKYHNFEEVSSEIRSVFDYLYGNYTEARQEILRRYGKVSEIDSENLMYKVICDVLYEKSLLKYNVVLHVPLRSVLSDFSKLNERELMFVKNQFTHVDFLVYSRLTHQPVLVIEVDGFKYHNNVKQQERDRLKDNILRKYGIPILRFSTIGSMEKEKLFIALDNIK